MGVVSAESAVVSVSVLATLPGSKHHSPRPCSKHHSSRRTVVPVLVLATRLFLLSAPWLRLWRCQPAVSVECAIGCGASNRLFLLSASNQPIRNGRFHGA